MSRRMQPKRIARKNRHNERGVALVLALLLVLILSTLAASAIFITNSEIWSTMNYRQMVQARYAAEAGAQSTINWLNSSSYTAPTDFTSYDMTKYPVQYNGKPVVLSANTGVMAANYPDATVQSAFNTALSSQSLTGITGAKFSTYATLLSMTPGAGASWLGGSGVMQVWQITSQGSINGVRNASVQVVATFGRTRTPIFNYSVAATATGCTAADGKAPIYFAGGTTTVTDSYNSSVGPYVYGSGFNSGTGETSGGDIAANGNIYLGGTSSTSNTNIEGTIYAVNTSVGACPNGITLASSTYDTYNAIKSMPTLPYTLPWNCSSTPCYPSPLPPTTNQDVSTSCSGITGCTSRGSTVIYDNGSKTTVNQFSLTPGNYGNLKVDNADVLYLSAGTYNVNSLDFAKDGQIVVSSGPVVLNVAGQGFTSCTSSNCSTYSATSGSSCTSSCGNEVINSGGLSGWNLCSNGLPGNVGALSNANCPTGPPVSGTPTSTAAGTITGIPSNLQIIYAGSSAIGATGAPLSSVIYAPNASVQMAGAPLAYYGSIVSNNFYDGANSPVHYDNALKNSVFQLGPYVPTGFSWSKY